MCICLDTHIHTSSHLPVMNLNSETLPHLGSTELLISVSQCLRSLKVSLNP